MKCPFCSDNIHPNAKYCPKCGLPIKDEPTVMGAAYVPDDPTANPWMLASGGLAVLALVFGIGWASSQIGRGPSQAAAPRTVAAYRTPGPGANTLTATPVTSGVGMASPAWGSSANSYAARPAAPAPAPSYTPTNTPVQWAYTPPPRTLNAGFLNDFSWVEPQAPEVPLFEIAKAARPREATVTVAQSTIPPVPEEPQAPQAMRAYRPVPGADVQYGMPVPGLAADGSPAPYYPEAASSAPATVVPESRRQWVWDPVHEAWARNPEYTGSRQRRIIRNTGTYR